MALPPAFCPDAKFLPEQPLLLHVPEADVPDLTDPVQLLQLNDCYKGRLYQVPNKLCRTWTDPTAMLVALFSVSWPPKIPKIRHRDLVHFSLNYQPFFPTASQNCDRQLGLCHRTTFLHPPSLLLANNKLKNCYLSTKSTHFRMTPGLHR